jgi:hypothetical protein
MWVEAGGQTHEIDARPSDAITLALHQNTPIFVTAETWDQAAAKDGLVTAGRESQLEEIHLKMIAAGMAEPEAKAMEFRSYRSLRRAEVPGLLPRDKPTA